jgi:uncharacterized membrane protein YeaQ/YmgE (transglycosylase-associated protein family)
MRDILSVGTIFGTLAGILITGLMVRLNHLNIVQHVWMPLIGGLLGGFVGTRLTYTRHARRFGIYASVLGAVIGIPVAWWVERSCGITGDTVGAVGIAILGCVGAAVFGALGGALIPGLRHGALLGARVAVAIAAVVGLAFFALVWVAIGGARW